MGKGFPRSLSRGEPLKQDFIKQTITVDEATISVTGAAGDGWGTVVMGDFPEGNILFLGAVAYMTFTGPTSANLDDTWEGDYSIGTTATTDATLAGTDVNLIASTALAAATAEVSPRTRATGSTAAIFDNTDGSLEINVNLKVDDANIGADMDFTVSGQLFIVYTMLGDD